MRLLNVEAVEQRFPIVYLYRREHERRRRRRPLARRHRDGARHHALPGRADRGDHQRRRQGVSTHGGDGAVRRLPVADGAATRPQGHRPARRFAGAPDARRRATRWRAGEELLLRGKSNGTPLAPGDVARDRPSPAAAATAIRSTASRSAVARDVALGYVSREAAGDLYGVVCDADGVVDADATDARAARLLDRAARMAAGAASWSGTSPSRRDRDRRRPASADGTCTSTSSPATRATQRVLACARCDTRLGDYRGNYKLGLLARGPVTVIPGVRGSLVVHRRARWSSAASAARAAMSSRPTEIAVRRRIRSWPSCRSPSGARTRPQLPIGVDIGGTFTDAIVVDDGGTRTIGKAPSTPPTSRRVHRRSLRGRATHGRSRTTELCRRARRRSTTAAPSGRTRSSSTAPRRSGC